MKPCADSVWPLYAHVAPACWLIYPDGMQGRSRLNFSEYLTGPQRGAGEIVENLQSGEMPPAIYPIMHPTARLTAAKKQELITGLRNSLK